MTENQPKTQVPDLRPVTRIISTIQITRTLLLFFIVAATAIAFVSGQGGLFSIVVLFYGVIAALGTYVLFGWFEHTLGLLAGIYRNTLR